MNPEVLVIKFLLTYENYAKWRSRIDSLEFSKEMRPFLFALDNLFAKQKEVSAQELGIEVYRTGKKDRELLSIVAEQLLTAEPPNNVEELLDTFHKAKTLRDLATAAYEASIDGSVDKIYPLVEKLEKTEEISEEYVTDDIDSILADTALQPGLRWRLNTLNRSLGSLRTGNFGFIFARPEVGKTTFIASEVTFMSEQTDRPVIWINNEQPGKEVMLRVYQAKLGATLDQIKRNPQKAKEAYERAGKILLVDKATISRKEIEALAEKEKPSLIVIDQLDKVTGFDAEREDLVLGKKYIWARELAKRFCPVIGVSQADGTAEGIQWLNMGHVSNAKTAKQAEADFILGIGMLLTPGFEDNRFISICKNKLLGDEDTDPKLRHARLEVLIDPERARYLDLEET